ncbi:hypothetical protein B0H63DRAFT_452780 [Podospora didyma]|uniref:Uncharacterized protein n=1 Tax=Podospora didyma TaxID=330526 RepID=A0AAE0N996_9PEZI|nr:hypothetical protein B0H63DRAFT_452780 [Podospora didyma]
MPMEEIHLSTPHPYPLPDMFDAMLEPHREGPDWEWIREKEIMRRMRRYTMRDEARYCTTGLQLMEMAGVRLNDEQKKTRPFANSVFDFSPARMWYEVELLARTRYNALIRDHDRDRLEKGPMLPCLPCLVKKMPCSLELVKDQRALRCRRCERNGEPWCVMYATTAFGMQDAWRCSPYVIIPRRPKTTWVEVEDLLLGWCDAEFVGGCRREVRGSIWAFVREPGLSCEELEALTRDILRDGEERSFGAVTSVPICSFDNSDVFALPGFHRNDAPEYKADPDYQDKTWQSFFEWRRQKIELAKVEVLGAAVDVDDNRETANLNEKEESSSQVSPNNNQPEQAANPNSENQASFLEKVVELEKYIDRVTAMASYEYEHTEKVISEALEKLRRPTPSYLEDMGEENSNSSEIGNPNQKEEAGVLAILNKHGFQAEAVPDVLRVGEKFVNHRQSQAKGSATSKDALPQIPEGDETE